MPSKTEKTVYDTTTGKLERVVTFDNTKQSEPPFVKIYFDTQLSLNNLNSSLAPYVIEFSKYMTFANDKNYKHMVQTTQIVKSMVAASLGVTLKAVESVITKLIKGGIFIPIYRETEDGGIVSKKKMNSAYFVNPWVIAKGNWNDIKELRQQIDFVKGESCYVIGTSDEHEGDKRMRITTSLAEKNAPPKIEIGIPKEGTYRQLSFFDNPDEIESKE